MFLGLLESHGVAAGAIHVTPYVADTSTDRTFTHVALLVLE
jgi:hypothetical protein